MRSSISKKNVRARRKQPARMLSSGPSHLIAPNNNSSSSSGRVASVIRAYTQAFVTNKSLINVSTGAVTYTNATSSVTCFAATAINVTSDPCFAASFTLADMPQYTTFTALYDRYRIKNIKVVFTPLYQQVALLSSTQALTITPREIWIAVDLDDSSVASPLSAIMEYESVRRYQISDKPIVVSWQPCVAQAAYSGAFTSYANVKSPWIDCGSSAVQHYGLKWGLPCPINTSFGNPPFSLVTEFTVEFTGVR
jgi:hypothetical protein